MIAWLRRRRLGRIGDRYDGPRAHFTDPRVRWPGTYAVDESNGQPIHRLEFVQTADDGSGHFVLAKEAGK